MNPLFFINCGVKKKAALVLFVIGILMSSCYKDKTVPVDPAACSSTISYSQDIVPIINQSCITGLGPLTGCHDAWIHEYSNVVAQINGGGWQNTVWQIYTMPKIPNTFGIDSLTADEVKIMRCWVEQGYPNN